MKRILLVCSDRGYRSRIGDLVRGCNNVSVTDVATSCDAKEVCDHDKFDLILAVSPWIHINGLECINEIVNSYPNTNVISLYDGSVEAQPHFRQVVLRMGVRRVLHLSSEFDDLLRIIEEESDLSK